MNIYIQWAIATPIILLEMVILWRVIDSSLFSDWLEDKAKEFRKIRESEQGSDK